MRAAIDSTKCQAHGICTLTAPAVFEVGEPDGYGYVRVEVIPPEDESAAQAASQGCPERAIMILD